MNDFTLDAYRQYLQAIKASYSNIFYFAEFFSISQPPNSFIIIRHDVDRKPGNALKMARLENEMCIQSTYYFRTKPHVFVPEIIAEIEDLGHEIGYHYESLSDSKGDQRSALQDFEHNLDKLRKIVTISTIAMHGSPISKHNNLDLWRNNKNRAYLKKTLEIHGEVYLDIDYADIAYISDTGRNWSQGKSNRRDIVYSKMSPNFKDGLVLLDSFSKVVYPKVVFQVHPERWTDSRVEYCTQWAKDQVANIIKTIVR